MQVKELFEVNNVSKKYNTVATEAAEFDVQCCIR